MPAPCCWVLVLGSDRRAVYGRLRPLPQDDATTTYRYRANPGSTRPSSEEQLPVPGLRVLAVVQARAGSSRLPGKVLRPLGGTPVLGWVVRAARAAAGIDDVVVATSVDPVDDAVEEAGRALGVPVVRGSEDDVLSRFLLAVEQHPCDAVVRLTADCPLLDPALIGQVVALWRAAPEQDYVATTLVRTLPRGLDVELATADALRRVAATATG